MAPRASWKGYLKLSLVTCSVAMFNATTQTERVRFNTLNRKTGNRIRMQMIDSETGDVVERDETIKGFQAAKNEYVPVEPEELEGVALESTHTIDIERFIPKKDVDDLYLDEGYYLAPDDRVSVEAFSVIREAMRTTDTVAFGRVVLHNREKLVMLEPRGKGILAKSVRYQYEVRAEEPYFEDIPDKPVNKEMLKLATHIVETMRGKFDPSEFDDRYQNAVIELIKSKQAGKPIRAAAPERPSNVINLMDALRRSVKAEGKSSGKPKRAAKRAGSRGRSSRLRKAG